MGGEGQHSKLLGMKQFRVWSRVHSLSFPLPLLPPTTHTTQVFFTGQLLWAAGNCGVKLSILHLYTTIFRGPTFKRFCYILMALSVAYMLMTILVDFLICNPVALNWDDFVQGHCGNQRMAYLFTGIINLLIDVGIVVLPMPLVWKLQMPVAKRVGVSAMFGLGAL